MAYTVAIPNMSKGEIAPALYGRIDTGQYAAGLKRCRNFIVQRYGGVTFRPGTRLVGKIDDPTKPFRLAPFQFSIDQAYALLLGQGTMRPMAMGGFVLEQDTKITGATQATQCVLTVPFHGWAVDDRIYLTGITGMTELNGRFATILAVSDASHVTIDVDSTRFAAFVSSDGVANSAPPAPPPTPPVIPPIVVPSEPPVVGGGGGGGGTRCVSADRTMIRMANFNRSGPGYAKLARFVRPGEWIWTQHEDTMEWGAFRVSHVEIAREPIYASHTLPDATARHRFWLDAWRFAEDLGERAGKADVWKATVEGAHTYLSRHIESTRWVLSHNLKPTQELD